MTKMIRTWSLVFLVGAGMSGHAHAAQIPFGTWTDRSAVPLHIHVFYARPELVTYCVDQDMTMTTDRNACARPYKHACGVAVPWGGKYDRRELYAICDGWHPRFKDFF